MAAMTFTIEYLSPRYQIVARAEYFIRVLLFLQTVIISYCFFPDFVSTIFAKQTAYSISDSIGCQAKV